MRPKLSHLLAYYATMLWCNRLNKKLNKEVKLTRVMAQCPPNMPLVICPNNVDNWQYFHVTKYSLQNIITRWSGSTTVDRAVCEAR